MIRWLWLLLVVLLAPVTADAFPTVGATNGGGQSIETTSHTVNLPAGIQSGHLLIAIITVEGDNTLTVPTLTWPSGWTQLFAASINPTGCGGGSNQCSRFEARYRIADGSEVSTITVTSDNAERSTHRTLRITGHHATASPEASSVASGVSGQADPPSLSPSWGSAETLWLAVAGSSNHNDGFTICPTNYTNCEISSDAGTSTAVGHRTLAAASDDPGPFTRNFDSQSWGAATIAIRPAAGGAASCGGRLLLLGVGC